MWGRVLVRSGPCLLLGAALLLCAVPGQAQSVSDGAITGTITEASGAVLPGAALTITSPALVSGERTAVSGAEGRFVFLSLPPGTYELKASLQGFKSYAESGIVVGRGKTVDVAVRLEIGAFEETIMVTSLTPIVDTRSSRAGSPG